MAHEILHSISKLFIMHVQVKQSTNKVNYVQEKVSTIKSKYNKKYLQIKVSQWIRKQLFLINSIGHILLMEMSLHFPLLQLHLDRLLPH